MGRPRKTLPPSKERYISLRVTNDLYEAIAKGAETAHIPKGEYVRRLLTEKHPVINYEIVFNSTELLNVLGDLGKVGGNLNQIARYLNQGGTLTSDIRQEIRDCISEIYEMRDGIKEIAGRYRKNAE